MVIQETVVFRCSPDTLWQHIEDPEKQKLWMKGVLSNETTTPGTQGAGSRFRMVIREGRKDAVYDGEVLVRDYPRRLEVRLTGGNFSKNMAMRVDYRLTDLRTETRLDYTATLECDKPGFFLRLLLKMASLFARMQLRSFLNTLRTLVESPDRAA